MAFDLDAEPVREQCGRRQYALAGIRLTVTRIAANRAVRQTS